MAQLDLTTFFSQFLFLLIVSLVLYLFLNNFILPFIIIGVKCRRKINILNHSYLIFFKFFMHLFIYIYIQRLIFTKLNNIKYLILVL